MYGTTNKKERFFTRLFGAALLGLAFLLLSFPTAKVQAATCTPSAAQICCAMDDSYSPIVINGHDLGVSLYGPNWDASTNPPCVTFPASYLNATGTNTVAIKLWNTSTGEMWGTWYIDVTCSDGTHAYDTSSDGNIQSTLDEPLHGPGERRGGQHLDLNGLHPHGLGGAVAVQLHHLEKTNLQPQDGCVSGAAGVFGRGVGRIAARGVHVFPPGVHFGGSHAPAVAHIHHYEVRYWVRRRWEGTTPTFTFVVNICNTGGPDPNPVSVLDGVFAANSLNVVMWCTKDIDTGTTGCGQDNQPHATGPDFTGNSGQQFLWAYHKGFQGGGFCSAVTMMACDYYAATDGCVRTNAATLIRSTGNTTSNSVAVSALNACATNTFTWTPTYTPTRTWTPTYTPNVVTNTFTRTNTPTFTPTYTPTKTNTPTNLADADAYPHEDEYADQYQYADDDPDAHQYTDEYTFTDPDTQSDPDAYEHADEYPDPNSDGIAYEHADPHPDTDEYADSVPDTDTDQYADEHRDTDADQYA